MTALAGDVAEARHREALVDAAGPRVDLLVNNASVLGPSPQPALADYPLDELRRVYAVNVLAPLALAAARHAAHARRRGDHQHHLRRGGRGRTPAGAATARPRPRSSRPRGSSRPSTRPLRIHAVDPGDMRTQMQQEAFPGEDISDRPPPEDSVPGLLALIEGDRPSGRWQARELATVGA